MKKDSELTMGLSSLFFREEVKGCPMMSPVWFLCQNKSVFLYGNPNDVTPGDVHVYHVFYNIYLPFCIFQIPTINCF